jgi:hypothetical protein
MKPVTVAKNSPYPHPKLVEAIMTGLLDECGGCEDKELVSELRACIEKIRVGEREDGSSNLMSVVDQFIEVFTTSTSADRELAWKNALSWLKKKNALQSAIKLAVEDSPYPHPKLVKIIMTKIFEKCGRCTEEQEWKLRGYLETIRVKHPSEISCNYEPGSSNLKDVVNHFARLITTSTLAKELAWDNALAYLEKNAD